MADEYISRQRILNYIDDEYCMHCEHSDGVRCENCHYEDVRIAIKSMPATDVQPIVYAHKTINVGRRSYCSNCGKLAIMEDFCSKCGAKVKDGEQNENN